MSEQGFTASLTALANQKRAALLQERTRLQNEENSRAQAINELSGFNAASITNPHMRAAFEQQIRDVQDYISGVGEYEGQEYDVVGFARNLRKITNSYNSMIGHNNEDVKNGRSTLLTSATTSAEDSRMSEMGGIGTGKRIYSNNSLTTLENADQYHNNYFEPVMENGKYVYDENGGLMGREVLLDENDKPVIDPETGEFRYDSEVKSIYEMHAYANASNYSGETIEADLPSIMDIAQSDPAKNRLTFIKSTYDSQDYARIGTNPEDIHRDAVGRLFEDWWTTDSPMAKDWRESILFDTLKRAGQGTFELSEEDQLKFINGEELSVAGQAELDNIRNFAENIYYNESYSTPQIKGDDGGGGGGDDQDAIFNTSLFRTVNTSTYNPDTRRFDIGEGGAQRDMRGLVNTIEVTGSNVEGLPAGAQGYTIQNIGVNPMNTENPGAMFATIAIEVPVTDDDNPLGLDIGENGTVIQYVDVQVGPNMGGLGEEIFNTLGTGDNLVYQNYLLEQRNAALPSDPDEFAAFEETMELIEADRAIVERSTQGANLYSAALDDIPGYAEGGTLRGDIQERLNDHTAYTGDNEEYRELGLTVSEVAQQEIYDNFTEDNYMDVYGAGIGDSFKGLFTLGGISPQDVNKDAKQDYNQIKNVLPNPVEDAKRRKTEGDAEARREEVAEERRQEQRDERREEEDRAEELKNRRIQRRQETRDLQDELGYQDAESYAVDPETGERIYEFEGPEGEDEIFQLLINNPIDSRAGRYFKELQRRADGEEPRKVTYSSEDGVLTIEGEEKTEPDGGIAQWETEIIVPSGYNNPDKTLKTQAFDRYVEMFEILGHPFPEAAAAQGAVESNWGSQMPNNNFFGMKAGSANKTQKALREAGVDFTIDYIRTEEVVDAATLKRLEKKHGNLLINKGKDTTDPTKTRVSIPGEPFLVFATPEDGFKGYMAFIKQNFPKALKAKTGKAYLEALQDGGYATATNYVSGIIARAESADRSIDPDADAVAETEVEKDSTTEEI